MTHVRMNRAHRLRRTVRALFWGPLLILATAVIVSSLFTLPA